MSQSIPDQTIDPGVLDTSLPLPLPLYIHLPPDLSCLEGHSTLPPDPNTLIDPLLIQSTSQQAITTSVSSTTPLHLEQKLEEEVAICQTSFQSRETAVHDVSTDPGMDDVLHTILDQEDGSEEQRDIPTEPRDITNISSIPLECLPHSLDVNQGLSQPIHMNSSVFDPLPLPLPLYIHLPPDLSYLEGHNTPLPDHNTLTDPLPSQSTSQQAIITSVSSTTPLQLEQKLEEEVAICQTSFQSRETALYDVSTNAEIDDVLHMILDQEDGSEEQRDIPKEPRDITNISPLPLESLPHSLDVNQGMSQPIHMNSCVFGSFPLPLPLPLPPYIRLPPDLSCLEGHNTPPPDPNTLIDPLPIQSTSQQAITAEVEEVAMCQTFFRSRETAVHDVSTDPEMDDVLHLILDPEDGSGEQRDIPKESQDVNQGMSQPDKTINSCIFDPLPLPLPLYIHLPPDLSCLEGHSTPPPDPNTLNDSQSTSQQATTTSVSSTTPLQLEQKLEEEVAACQTHFQKETTIHNVNGGNSLEDRKMHLMKDKKQLAKERKREKDKAFAVCYRKRKKGEKSDKEKRCEELMARNTQLKLQVSKLTSEIAHLQSCWEKTKVSKRKKTCSFIFFPSKKNFSGTYPHQD